MKNLTLIIFLALTLVLGACSGSESEEKKKEPKKQKDPQKQIAIYDTDKDGKISLEEMTTTGKERFSKKDKNQDGFLQKDELESKKKKDSDKRFIKLDADKDGQVTMEEWLVPIEENFKKADGNNDGFLSEDELQTQEDKD